jgi:dienelactone hydrolase
MYTKQIILGAIFNALLAAQTSTQELTASARALRQTSTANADAKAKADALLSEAQRLQTSGAGGEARRRAANALALLKGETWDSKQEFAWSLTLRPDNVVSDSALPLIARISQSYSAPYHASNGLKVRASLRADGKDGDGKPSRPIGLFDFASRDLIEQPYGFDGDLDGVADGAYVLKAEVLDGADTVTNLEAPVQIVKGIVTDRAAIEKRLAKVPGHDSAKASVRYPWVLAETVNVGRRQLSPADFGLPFQPQLPYDFASGVRNSAELLKALEAGKDPLWRARGDHERHYWFEEAREMMAYHVYAPQKWDGKSKLPMVLVLHGNTRDQDYYFDRDDHVLAKTAEQHGFLVVCPMGYRPSAGWGSNSLSRRPADPSRSRQGDLSEKDGLNVLDLVTKEYPVDPARIYLFGHSAGGAGTWYLGEKYPEKWAAIAASAAATSPDGFPFERLKGLPLMVVHGDADTEVPIARSQAMVKAAKENGLDPDFLVIPGATHITAPGLAEPRVFDFFEKYRRKTQL